MCNLGGKCHISREYLHCFQAVFVICETQYVIIALELGVLGLETLRNTDLNDSIFI